MIKFKFVINQLRSLNEKDCAHKIFDKTWAMESRTEITPNLLQAMIHSGAYLSGAFIEKMRPALVVPIKIDQAGSSRIYW